MIHKAGLLAISVLWQSDGSPDAKPLAFPLILSCFHYATKSHWSFGAFGHFGPVEPTSLVERVCSGWGSGLNFGWKEPAANSPREGDTSTASQFRSSHLYIFGNWSNCQSKTFAYSHGTQEFRNRRILQEWVGFELSLRFGGWRGPDLSKMQSRKLARD